MSDGVNDNVLDEDYFENGLFEITPSTAFPVSHGTWFDHGQRWCGLCNRTRPSLAESEDRPGKHLSCDLCETLWPEAAQDFALGMLSDEDIGLDFHSVMH